MARTLWPWAGDYAPRCGFSEAAGFIHSLLDEFLERGLAREQAGLLSSLVPR